MFATENRTNYHPTAPLNIYVPITQICVTPCLKMFELKPMALMIMTSRILQWVSSDSLLYKKLNCLMERFTCVESIMDVIIWTFWVFIYIHHIPPVPGAVTEVGHSGWHQCLCWHPCQWSVTLWTGRQLSLISQPPRCDLLHSFYPLYFCHSIINCVA